MEGLGPIMPAVSRLSIDLVNLTKFISSEEPKDILYIDLPKQKSACEIVSEISRRFSQTVTI